MTDALDLTRSISAEMNQTWQASLSEGSSIVRAPSRSQLEQATADAQRLLVATLVELQTRPMDAYPIALPSRNLSEEPRFVNSKQ
jgi:hypothetical protein